MPTRNDAYRRACLASEKIRDDAYRAADQLSADAITDADAKLRQARFSAEARAARDATYCASGDARAAAYAEAEQQHRDRLAAIERHFGQQISRRGDPDADHALAFVETVADPEGLYRPQPVEAPIGRMVEIAYNGIKRQVRVDANGRVVAENPIADDGWSNRGTFSGDAEAFLAQSAGVGLKPNPEEPPPAPPIPPPPMIRAEPQPEPPPPGLLADIAAALARVESKLRLTV